MGAADQLRTHQCGFGVETVGVNIEGTQQSGLPISLNIASLAKDGLILNAARAAADSVLQEDPTLTADRNQMLRRELRKEKYQIRDYSKIS